MILKFSMPHPNVNLMLSLRMALAIEFLLIDIP